MDMKWISITDKPEKYCAYIVTGKRTDGSRFITYDFCHVDGWSSTNENQKNYTHYASFCDLPLPELTSPSLTLFPMQP